MAGLTYDTGALVAAQRNDARMWAIHRRALERGVRPSVPAGVLVEAWAGPDVNLSRFLAGCEIEPLDEKAARQAGVLRARCPRDVSAVDATCVEGALRRDDACVSSDRDDLNALAAGTGRKLDIITI